MFLFCLLIGIGLPGYSVIRTWRASGVKKALERKAFFWSLATAGNTSSIISEEDFVDTYYFGTGQTGDVQSSNRVLSSRILAACITLFRIRSPFKDDED
jgi:hypothetical protein